MGNSVASQFTSDQLQNIANNYSFLVIEKSHGEFHRESHQEAARLLKAINPQLQILEYFSTTLHFDPDTDPAHTFNTDWALKDDQGNVIEAAKPGKDTGTCERIGVYVDLANADYQAWVLQVLTDWFTAAPFDGVAFDSANFITPSIVPPITCAPQGTPRSTWQELMSQDRITAWNNGLRTLFQQVRAKFPDKLILFNGIEDIPAKVNRDLELFDWANIGMNEDFCIQDRADVMIKDQILADIQLMQQLAAKQKVVFEKTNHALDWQPTDAQYIQTGRYCFGAFLLGYEPGYAYYKYGYGYESPDSTYHTDEITQNPQEMNVNLGAPTGQFQTTGNVYYREFEHGIVYVNFESSAQSVTLPQNLQLVTNGAPGESYNQSASYSIPAQDAVFFLKAS